MIQAIEETWVTTEKRTNRRKSTTAQTFRAIAKRRAKARAKSLASVLRICPVRNKEELEAVYRLTHDAYVGRGYIEPRRDGRLVHYPHLDNIPETTVLVAKRGGKIVGTISLTIDGPAGLHVDEDFKKETNCIRREERKLGACWRIATTSASRNEGIVVLKLLREVARLGKEMNVMTGVFTMNPRHRRVYERLLNMEVVAYRASTHGLRSAPAVLMRWDMEKCPESWMPEEKSVGNQVQWKGRKSA